MSGIRYIIAIVFLFAGLEDELRANASHVLPADSPYSSSDIMTNLSSRTSVDKMTKTAPDGVPGLLPARVMAKAPYFASYTLISPSAAPASSPATGDAFRASGSSPPV